MTQELILEGNKLIADFMQFSVTEMHGNWMYADYDGMREVEYNDSWEWLMPVVEKIESIGFRVVIGFNTYCCIIKSEKVTTKDTPRFESTHAVKEPASMYTWSAPSKIEGVYIAVVKFIKWYNTIKNK